MSSFRSTLIAYRLIYSHNLSEERFGSLAARTLRPLAGSRIFKTLLLKTAAEIFALSLYFSRLKPQGVMGRQDSLALRSPMVLLMVTKSPSVMKSCAFIALLLALNIDTVFARSQTLVCTNKEDNFVMTFRLDSKLKSITHVSSLEHELSVRSLVNERLNVLRFEENFAMGVGYSSNESIVNFLVFNFANYSLTTSAHDMGSQTRPQSYVYTCTPKIKLQ